MTKDRHCTVGMDGPSCKGRGGEKGAGRVFQRGIWRKFCMGNFSVSAMGENTSFLRAVGVGLKSPRETMGL